MKKIKIEYRYWILITAILVFLTITIGGVQRTTNSGLNCADWFSCVTNWNQIISDGSQFGYIHLVLSLITGIAIVIIFSIANIQKSSMKWVKRPLNIAIFLFGLQIILKDSYTAIHFGNSLLILGLILIAAIVLFVKDFDPAQEDRLNYYSKFSKQTLVSLSLVFLILITGVGDANNTVAWVNLIHQLSVGIASIYLVWMLFSAWRTQRTQRAILTTSTTTVILFFSQAFIGAVYATPESPLYLLGLHISSSALVWASIVIQTVFVGLAARSQEEEDKENALPLIGKQRFKDLLTLTKPIIVILLLVTTYAGMVVGGGAIPSFSLTLWTMLGGALAAGGSGAINQYIDREIDQKMTRTANRPIASGRLFPAEGLAFGLGTLIVSFYMLAGLVNLLAALLSLAGMIYYIVLYSLLLKYSSEQNIVIGGGAGAIPPMVGWAAATGTLNWTAFFLFAIVFMWTPPHFWALALIRKNDYAKAGIPMMPVIRGDKETRWLIMLYTIELVVLTLLMPVFNMAGTVYLVSAAILGGGLLYYAAKVWRVGGNKIAWGMYRYSSLYLGFLFIALMVDALI